MATKEQQIKNSFIYLLPSVLGSLIPMATLPIFTRILTTEDYGVLALAQVYALFASGIANLGLANVYNRNFFQYRDLRNSAALLYSSMLCVGLVHFGLAVVTYVFMAQLAKWIIGAAGYAVLLFWAYCTTGIVSLKSFYFAYYKNSENAGSFAKITICEQLLNAGLALFLVMYLQVGVIGLVIGQLGANIIIFSTLTFLFLKRFPFSLNKERLCFQRTSSISSAQFFQREFHLSIRGERPRLFRSCGRKLQRPPISERNALGPESIPGGIPALRGY